MNSDLHKSNTTLIGPETALGTSFIVSESVSIDWTGNGPAAAWKMVTDAVHEAGGKMFLQTWHAGRCAHDEMSIAKEYNAQVIAPSSIKVDAGEYRDLPGRPGHMANVHAIKDPKTIFETYRNACSLAKKAGFDGIELLAQGGYLPQQFLNSRTNKRTNKYGGTVENRCCFILETIDAITEGFDGPEAICVKICPTNYLNDSVVDFDEMKEVYTYLINEMVKLIDFEKLVKFPGSPSKLMANNDYTVGEADRLIKEGRSI
ncbi:12-oxophytodienoate reductase opr, putative [Talaromyces stipitatus ATCC 10500]|uniref:12-oxophytodienoate reductase opr, putative n=1 Tax=Talaromyces stipitatus (strain ATCC 10500 / CBS 375.48 / QM 6759 / NRRL 1006) TaxID=441959 RepID=B8M495_TALSN|nr:12-oxophytodienoate reductase opr, putative [Talaromyces stipitatus ATCC 10500]EED19090.1 12-oxophytodienoate reductase opr, putative [Talaromyces stipitatus ATCC 10500]